MYSRRFLLVDDPSQPKGIRLNETHPNLKSTSLCHHRTTFASTSTTNTSTSPLDSAMANISITNGKEKTIDLEIRLIEQRLHSLSHIADGIAHGN